MIGAMTSLFLIVVVFGGIPGGVYSAAGVSAIAVAYALFLANVIYREFKCLDISWILPESAK